MDVASRYLELGLRLGRHVDGLVDSYFGPPEIADRVAGEELRAPDALLADAETLREDVAADEALGERRRAWLDDQLVGVATYARILGGEEIAYSDEVERCFGIRPERVPEETFAAAHERLEALLPGKGSLVDRIEAWRAETTVPAEVVLEAFNRVSDVLREATLQRYGLPDDEQFEAELVHDEPWAAYNYYLGGRRSRIAINVDRPIWASFLVTLASHEAYPGHHTEHALKESGLVASGVLEESLFLVPTPQSMVSEAIAENAWEAVADDETAAAVAAALADLGVTWPLEKAEAIAAASHDLRFVSSNVALLIYDEGASTEDAAAYLERWSPATPERALAATRFVLDKLWRAYTSTYSYGGALARQHVNGDHERFRALLTQQTRVADLLPAAGAVSSGS